MKADDLTPEYKNMNNDMLMQRQMHDSRKPTITLASLHKLKKMRAAKDLENLMRGDFFEIIYGQSQEGGAGPGGGI